MIKNFIGWLLGYYDCYLCGNTLWHEDTGYYGSRVICGKCKKSATLLIHNLRSQFYIDPNLGAVLGTTVFCPNCNDDTCYRYIFEDSSKRKPIGAYCPKCGKKVSLGGLSKK